MDIVSSLDIMPSMAGITYNVKGEGRNREKEIPKVTTSTETVESANEPEIKSEEAINTSDESSSDKTIAESEDLGNYSEPTDFSFIVAPNDEEKKEESNGFDPTYYQHALDLTSDDSAFSSSLKTAERLMNQRKESLDYLPEDSEYRGGIQRDYDKQKKTYEKLSADRDVFQKYIDTYKEDWDNYQKSQPEPEKEVKLVNIMRGIEAELREYLKEDLKDPGFRQGFELNMNSAIKEGDAYDKFDRDDRRDYAVEYIQGLWNHMVDKGVIPKEKADEYRSRVNDYVTNNPDSSEKTLKVERDKVYEQYKNGEITAVEFANKMTQINNKLPSLDFSAPKGSVAEAEKISTPGSEEYEATLGEFKYLNSLKDKITAFDVSDINETNYEQKQKEIVELEAETANLSNKVLVDLTRNLVSQGKSIDEIRNSEEIKQFSNELFELAQNIYDKADSIEKEMVRLGIDQAGKSGNFVSRKWNELVTTTEAVFNSVKTGQPLNATAGYAVLHSMDNIQGVKQAAEALMKSAAFNGAANVKGGQAAEAMKQEAATKLSWKDWVATSTWGTLGILSTIVGVATGNPILIGAGIYVNLKKGGEFAGKVAMTNVTKEEQMFGMEDSDIMNRVIDVYNQSQEKANLGDPKSASTYVSAGTGVVDVISGVTMFVNPLTSAAGVSQIKDGLQDLFQIRKGGLAGNARALVNNVYNLGAGIEAMTDESVGLPIEQRIENLFTVNTSEGSDVPKAGYGTSSGSESVKGKYSGYKEKAKNSNIATDYNRGMEQETTEAVSDMKAKIFKVYSSEPEYIRKAIEKVLKSYKEII